MSKCSICLSNKPGLVYPYLGKGTCYPNHLVCSVCMNQAKSITCPVCRSERVDVHPQIGKHRIEDRNVGVANVGVANGGASVVPNGVIENEIIFDKWYKILKNRNTLVSLFRVYLLGYIASVLLIGMYWSLTNIIECPTLFRGFWGFLVGILVGSLFSLVWPILALSLSLYVCYYVIGSAIPSSLLK